MFTALFKKPISTFVFALVLVLGSSKALATELSPMPKNTQCVSAAEIARWQPVSAFEALIWKNDVELPMQVKFGFPCFRLMFANNVTLSAEQPTQCLSDGATLIVHNSRFDAFEDDIMTPQSCPIAQVDPLCNIGWIRSLANAQERSKQKFTANLEQFYVLALTG